MGSVPRLTGMLRYATMPVCSAASDAMSTAIAATNVERPLPRKIVTTHARTPAAIHGMTLSGFSHTS